MFALTSLHHLASSLYKFVTGKPKHYKSSHPETDLGPKETDIGAIATNLQAELHKSSSPEGLQTSTPQPVQSLIEPEPNKDLITSAKPAPSSPLLGHSNWSRAHHPSATQTQAQTVQTPSTCQPKREKQLEETILQLQTEKDELLYRYSELYNNHDNLLLIYHATMDDLRRSEIQLNSVSGNTSTLENDNSRLHKKCSALETDNDKLRSQIVSLCNAPEPLREEKYYIIEFEQIKNNIDSWVAIQTRSKPTGPLSNETRNAISSAIASFGETGCRSVENIIPQFLMFYGDRRKRIALIRHIIAIFLFEKIFSRFAFGLDRNYSEYLKNIESEIYGSDLNLSKIVMISQSLGMATLTAEKDSIDCRRAIYITQIISLLRLLLPETSQETLETFVTRIIDKSIALRQAMTEEQAVYRCFVPDRGDPFDESIAQVLVGEEVTGNILMCTFPGMRRFTVRNQMKEFVSVAKAAVKLEGAFGPEITKRS